MADIIQAVKWMQEGKPVRRSTWAKLNPELAITAAPAELIFDLKECGYGFGKDCVVNANLRQVDMYFSTDALLADDWEIAE